MSIYSKVSIKVMYRKQKQAVDNKKYRCWQNFDKNLLDTKLSDFI